MFSIPSVGLVEKPQRILQPLVAEISRGVISNTESDSSPLHQYQRMNEYDLFAKPGDKSEGSDWDVIGNIFALDDVKIGKAHLSGSVVTAIKRKNPIHLLNPIIFEVAW